MAAVVMAIFVVDNGDGHPRHCGVSRQLGCLFLFSGTYLLGPKTVPDRIPEDFFFPAFSGGNFHRNVVLERPQEFRFFS